MGKTEILRETLTWKVIILGIVLEIIAMLHNHTWMVYQEGAYFVRDPLFRTTNIDWYFVIWVFFLMLIAAAVGQAAKLSKIQLAVLYIFAGTGGVAGMIQWQVAKAINMPEYNLRAFDEGWIPSYWTAPSKEAFDVFTKGGIPPWGDLVVPFTFWGLVVFTFLMFTLFLMALYRRLWVDIEGLPFPQAQPVNLIVSPGEQSEEVPIYKHKWFMVGFALGFILFMTDLIHFANPYIPRIPIGDTLWYTGQNLAWDVTPYIRGALPVHLQFWYIFMYYWFPLDAMLTLFIFLIALYTILPAVGLATGFYPELPADFWSITERIGWTYTPYVWVTFAWGSMFGTVIWILIGPTGRGYLVECIKTAIRGGKETGVDESKEALSYRWIVVGTIVFFLAHVVLLSINIPAGAIAYLIIFTFVGQLFRLRQRAEFWNLGLDAWHEWPLQGPTLNLFIPDARGGPAFRADIATKVNLDIGAISSGPAWSKYADGFKIFDHIRAHTRILFWAAVIATVFYVVFGFPFYYWLGSAGLKISPASNVIGDVVWGNNVPADYRASTGGAPLGDYSAVVTRLPWWIAGTVLTIFAWYAKARWIWWPLNPLGWYMISAWGYPGEIMTLLYTIIAKVLIMRLGGARLNKKFMIFSLAFILGIYTQKLIQWPIVYFVLGTESVTY